MQSGNAPEVDEVYCLQDDDEEKVVMEVFHKAENAVMTSISTTPLSPHPILSGPAIASGSGTPQQNLAKGGKGRCGCPPLQ